MNETDFNALMAKALCENCLENGYTDEQLHSLFLYIDFLLETNKSVNLTAIRDAESAVYRHIIDVIYALPLIKPGARLMDVGSGGGIPAIPFAILRPDITVTALDATGKKVSFISDAINALSLRNAGALCARAEEIAADRLYRERYDTVSARAVASLPELSELCIPLCKQDGNFIAFKGKTAAEELKKAKNAVFTLGCELENTLDFTLKVNGEEEERHIFSFVKLRRTPTVYPRRYAQILKNPL